VEGSTDRLVLSRHIVGEEKVYAGQNFLLIVQLRRRKGNIDVSRCWLPKRVHDVGLLLTELHLWPDDARLKLHSCSPRAPYLSTERRRREER
jgi:hypothetical protein